MLALHNATRTVVRTTLAIRRVHQSLKGSHLRLILQAEERNALANEIYSQSGVPCRTAPDHVRRVDVLDVAQLVLLLVCFLDRGLHELADRRQALVPDVVRDNSMETGNV